MFFVIRGIECLWDLGWFDVIGPFYSQISAAAYLIQTGYSVSYDSWAKEISCGHKKAICSECGNEVDWCGSGEKCYFCDAPAESMCECVATTCIFCADGVAYRAEVVEVKPRNRASVPVPFLETFAPFIVLRTIFGSMQLIGFFESNDLAKAYLLKKGYHPPSLPVLESVELDTPWLLQYKGRLSRNWSEAWIKEIQTPVWTPPLYPQLLVLYSQPFCDPYWVFSL